MGMTLPAGPGRGNSYPESLDLTIRKNEFHAIARRIIEK
jgi:hypothetical protein